MNWRVSMLLLVVLVATLLAVVRHRFLFETADEDEPPRDDGWTPTTEVRTPRFLLRTSAPPDLTARLGDALEALHRAMDATVGELPTRATLAEPMRIHLYADRAEFRRVNHVDNWAEAFYTEPVSRLYLDPTSANPWHWGLHEAAHQVAREAYGLHLRRWLNEGVATYFGGAHLAGDTLEAGLADAEAYPIWHLAAQALTKDRLADLASGALIPLRTLVHDSGGPDIDRWFNKYYAHWFATVHFLLHGDAGRHRTAFRELLLDGGSMRGFVRLIGEFDQIEPAWHAHFHALVRAAAGAKGSAARRIFAGAR